MPLFMINLMFYLKEFKEVLQVHILLRECRNPWSFNRSAIYIPFYQEKVN